MNEDEDKRALIRMHIASILRFPPMKTENIVKLKRLRDTVPNALANLGSPVEHWDQMIVASTELKFSPETACEWNKSLGKSREFASYEETYDFLTICTRGCSDETSASVDVKVRGKSRLSVDSVSVPSCVNCAGSHKVAATTFFQSQSRSAVRLLRRSKFASIACGRVTLRRNARADRDVLVVVASIIRCCTPHRRPTIKR